MTSRPPLTAQDFQDLLTRADFGHSSLTITDTSDLPDVWAGQQGTCVLVTGPKDVRRQLFDVLYGRGVLIAPYPDRDYWRRI